MQRELLSEAMQRMGLQQHEGLKLGSVLLDTGRGFVTGMASVCEELIQLLGCDVIMLGVVHTNAKAQPFLSLIGRGSARAERSSVDLNKVLARWQGGGHPAAAAASIKLRGPDAVDANAAADVGPLLDAAEEAAAREAALSAGALSEASALLDVVRVRVRVRVSNPNPNPNLSEASALLEEAVAAIIDSVPAQACADDIMTKTLHSCSPEDSMDTALEMMNRIKVLGVRHPRQPSP